MAFREYKLGAMFFGFALSFSMMITLFFPTLYITDHGTPNDYGLDKTLTYGRNSAFTYSDPLLKQTNEPIKAILKVDPTSGKALASPMTVYIYQAGDPFPSNVVHPRILTGDIESLSVGQGKIDAASTSQGAVFTVAHQDSMPALKEAVARRDEHEVSVHNYRHVVRDIGAATPFQQPIARKGRPRRRTEDLSAV